MKASTDAFDEAYVSCLSCLMQCCAPLTFFPDDKSRHCKSMSSAVWQLLGGTRGNDLLMEKDDEEKHPFPVVGDQPVSQPRPMALLETELPRPSWKHKVHMGFPSQTSFSARSKLRPDGSPRHPQISAPFEFRHLDSASFQFPLPGRQPSRPLEAPPTRPASFRPLELSIFTRENELLPKLPSFNCPSTMPSPPLAYLPDRPQDPRNGYAPHQRSRSSASFHIPRRPVYESSPSTVREEMPPNIPPKAPGRARAYTSSEMEAIKERVASAMNEVEKLQRKIDEIVGRQSLYGATNRPSTSHLVVRATPGKLPSKAPLHYPFLVRVEPEQTPPTSALPPAAPSFAERLNAEVERPQTAPIDASVRVHPRKVSNNKPTASEQSSRAAREDRLPLPMQPLPLVLRPPLRKKKSFSRVSTWLFPEPEHSRDFGLDSATDSPCPVKEEGGLDRCVSPDERSGRRAESFGTVSTWETDDEDRTVPTTWSPESTPAAKQEEPLMIERSATFGENSNRPGIMDVGVAI